MSGERLRRFPVVGRFFAGEARPLVNSGGEQEADRAPGWFNLVEALVVFTLLQVAIWFFIGAEGARKGAHISVSSAVGYLIIGICAVWALFISPLLHGDTAGSFGLPAPGEGRAFVRGLRGGARVAYWAAGLVLCALVLVNLSFTTRKLGMRDTWLYKQMLSPEHIPTAAGYIVSCAVGFALYRAVTMFLIRWDNLWTSVKAMLFVAAASWGGVVLLGVLQARASGDWSLFGKFQWFGWDPRRAFIPRAGFYLFWGMIQQWVFLGYFHTRVRRGLPATPAGRLLVSALSGAFFGIIHIPSWPLAAVTFIGGAAFGYCYQFSRARNLFVMGIAHGIGGTLVAFLTDIRMNVGPWSVGN